jgi:hypothetical protein
MARPIAPRFEITVLKDKSSTDKAQVPATQAVINFYRAGATVSVAVTIPALAESVPVSVYDAGLLAVNDFVRPGTGMGPGTLVVSAVTGNQLLITSNMGSDVTLEVGMRLVPTNNRPNVFKDPLCLTSYGTSLAVDSVTARASAYLASNRVDYDVTITGQPLRLYVDGAGVIGRSDQRWIDLRDFGGDLQAAINALPPDGGIVFVPRGPCRLTSGVVVNAPNVSIVGEQLGSVITTDAPNTFDLITVNRPNFQMRDVKLDGAAGTYDANGKCCLVIQGVGVSNNEVRGVGLWNVTMSGAPRYALWLRDVEDLYARGCMIVENPGSGVRIDKVSAPTTIARFLGGEIGQNQRRGLEAASVSGVLAVGCTFEGNRIVGGEDDGAGVDIENCGRVELRSCYFEDAYNKTTTQTKQFVALRSCPSAILTECAFHGGLQFPERQPLRAVKFIASPSSRLSNCAGDGLSELFAVFDVNSKDCVEYGVWDSTLASLVARYQVGAERFVSMSRRAVGVPRHAHESTFPTGDALIQGAMVWVDSPSPGRSNLQVWGTRMNGDADLTTWWQTSIS